MFQGVLEEGETSKTLHSIGCTFLDKSISSLTFHKHRSKSIPDQVLVLFL